jgi:hypothetical protein
MLRNDCWKRMNGYCITWIREQGLNLFANFYFYSQTRAVSYLHVNNSTYILQVDLDSYRRKTVDFGAFGEHPVQRPGKLAG